MGTHFPAARLAAAVSSALALSVLIPLGGGTPASAAAASSLQAAFNNVGITTPATASAGNFDGIGDSFAARRPRRDALVPGQSLLHDGLTDRLAGRAARAAGQRASPTARRSR